MLQNKAKILYNKRIKGNYFHLVIKSAKISKNSSPGQFLNIKVNDAYEPLLRRPFSIHRVRGNDIELLYEVVGEATAILSGRKPGGYLDIIGPLGNGFDYRLPIPATKICAKNIGASADSCGGGGSANNFGGTDYRLPILIAGGIGIAPLLFLAEKIQKCQSIKVSKCQSMVLIGAKTESQILCEREFRKLGCAVKVSTDDGSRGFKGYVPGLLKKELSTIDYRLSTIYACGPRPMLKEISRISKKYNIPAQISLEEHLACGIGACLGCVVDTKDGFKRVCKEGPVFKADEIAW